MTTTSDTTARLLRLLSLLQTPRDWPGPVLAERLGVSDRTVRRDVDRLRELGYRIHAERGSAGAYRLEAGAELPPLLLDDDQATAITVALQAAPLLGTDVDEAAERALATIRRVMPPRLRHRADALTFETAPVVALGTGPAAGTDGTRTRGTTGTRSAGTESTGSGASPAAATGTDVLVAVSAAVRAREVLRFDYAGDAPDARPRRAEPHHLVATGGRWYVVAWDLDRDDWRVFRADRMTPRTPRGARFVRREVPGGDVRRFLARRFTGTTAGGWPCLGTVVLDLPPRDVTPFAAGGVVEDLGNGRTRLTTGSWSWTALAASLGRFDADVHVEGPAELRAAFSRLASRYATAAAGP